MRRRSFLQVAASVPAVIFASPFESLASCKHRDSLSKIHVQYLKSENPKLWDYYRLIFTSPYDPAQVVSLLEEARMGYSVTRARENRVHLGWVTDSVWEAKYREDMACEPMDSEFTEALLESRGWVEYSASLWNNFVVSFLLESPNFSLTEHPNKDVIFISYQISWSHHLTRQHTLLFETEKDASYTMRYLRENQESSPKHLIPVIEWAWREVGGQQVITFDDETMRDVAKPLLQSPLFELFLSNPHPVG